MPTSALTPIRDRADVGIGPYELNSTNPDLALMGICRAHAVGAAIGRPPEADACCGRPMAVPTALQIPFCVRQKNGQRDSRKPGITTIRKKAQLTRVKVLTNFPPRPGYSRT